MDWLEKLEDGLANRDDLFSAEEDPLVPFFLELASENDLEVGVEEREPVPVSGWEGMEDLS